MQYINFILLTFILAFSTIYIYNIFILKNWGKENLKVSSLLILFSIPIVIFIFIVMGMFLNLATWILPIEISNYKIFVTSFVCVFIVLIGEFIIKCFLSRIISNHFEKKYKDNKLSENEMINIIKNKHNIIELLKFILMYITSIVIYTLLFNILGIVSIAIMVILSSVITSIIYLFMFKSK